MYELVSVIVPIYNIEDYIDKCIESIIHQTYFNIEIILVNDCSSDSSKEVCEKWKELDERIILINKEQNEGLSCARNTGLVAAKGKYITFIDGDDYVSNDFIELLYEAVKADNAEIAACSFFYVENGFEVERKKAKVQRKVIYSSTDAIREYMKYPSLVDVVAWNKLYLRSLFLEHNVMYPPGKIHEDLFTTYKLIYYAQKIVYVDLPLYYYVQRSNSIMHIPNIEREQVLLECCDEYTMFLHSHPISIEEELVEFYQYRLIAFLINTMADNRQIYNRKIWNHAYEKIVNLYSLRNSSFKYSLIIHVMKFPRLYTIIRKIFKKV
ncbi:MAG: glycosyltransferase [Lachnospiraceae bacterium]|nr:glycosyltransferase [Lachnospiraceae bacterium]